MIKSILQHALLLVGLVFLGQCSRSDEPASSLEEGWDKPNEPGRFGVVSTINYRLLSLPEYLRGRLATKPWSDDYWPLYRGGLASRWLWPDTSLIFDDEVEDYDETLSEMMTKFLADSEAVSPEMSWRLSPAEKYDRLFGLTGEDGYPFTKYELGKYADNHSFYTSEDISWGWMGYCHGWAVASYSASPPRYPVLAQLDDNPPVIITAGDIRGYLTRIYSDNAKDSEEKYIGSRCERDYSEIAVDSSQRPVDGEYGTWNEESGSFENTTAIEIIFNNWRIDGQSDLSASDSVIVFREQGSSTIKWLRAVDWVDYDKEIFRVEVREAVGAVMDENQPATYQDFRYLKSCRDLNPASFHIVLTHLLSDAAMQTAGRRGFTIETARSKQIWNQPIYGYRSLVGEPLDVTTLRADGPQDPYAKFRALGTRYLVHVFTTVEYGVENGPFISYEAADDWTVEKTYQYTLELDAMQNVIGGEWHADDALTALSREPLTGEALLETLNRQIMSGRTADAPDFLWRYPQGTKATNSCYEGMCLDADIIYQLQECSTREPSGDDTLMIDGAEMPYVQCQLSSER